MDYTNNSFDYGGWKNAWFVKDNKPLMLKYDGTIDYYLDPNNYTKRADTGASSDILLDNYDGNAMAQIPLCYVCRYEDDLYEYQIVSNVKFDDTYLALAHTNASGQVRDYFYYSIYGGYKDIVRNSIRSLSGRTLVKDLTAEQEIIGCRANNSSSGNTNWFTHTYSQRELIKTLLILMAKSTDLKTAYGNGRATNSGESLDSTLETGTLNLMGQFYGSNNNYTQMKVFHIEKFWGDQWDRVAGCVYHNNKLYLKMTPEGSGYKLDAFAGYYDTGITMSGGTLGKGYISKMKCDDYGLYPKEFDGSNDEYYCDYGGYAGNLNYALFGGSSRYATDFVGAFACDFTCANTHAAWDVGCGLSYIS